MTPAPVIRLHPDDGVLIARASLPPGMVVADGAARAINMGFKLVTLLNDVGLMSTYARLQVNQTREKSGGKA